MEKIDLIKSAHVIDYHLTLLSASVTDDVLNEKILSVQAEWRELAYSISAHLSGVEVSVQSPVPKKRGRRKKIVEPAEVLAQGENSNTQAVDSEQENVTQESV